MSDPQDPYESDDRRLVIALELSQVDVELREAMAAIHKVLESERLANAQRDGLINALGLTKIARGRVRDLMKEFSK